MRDGRSILLRPLGPDGPRRARRLPRPAVPANDRDASARACRAAVRRTSCDGRSKPGDERLTIGAFLGRDLIGIGGIALARRRTAARRRYVHGRRPFPGFGLGRPAAGTGRSRRLGHRRPIPRGGRAAGERPDAAHLRRVRLPHGAAARVVRRARDARPRSDIPRGGSRGSARARRRPLLAGAVDATRGRWPSSAPAALPAASGTPSWTTWCGTAFRGAMYPVNPHADQDCRAAVLTLR